MKTRTTLKLTAPTPKQAARCVAFLRRERDRLKELGIRLRRPSPSGPLAFALGLAAEWLNTAREREQLRCVEFRKKKGVFR
jgi:hypothetical protein